MLKCKECGKVLRTNSPQASKIHLKYKHDITMESPEELDTYFERLPDAPKETKEIVKTSAPVTPSMFNSPYPITSKSAMDELEASMAQQLRIMNMHQMMTDLRSPKTPAPQQQRSDFDNFMSMLNATQNFRNSIKNEVAEEFEQAPEGASEDAFPLKIVEALIATRGNPQHTLTNNGVVSPQQPGVSQMQIPNVDMNKIEEMIRAGQITKDQAWSEFSKYSSSKELFEEQWARMGGK